MSLLWFKIIEMIEREAKGDSPLASFLLTSLAVDSSMLLYCWVPFDTGPISEIPLFECICNIIDTRSLWGYAFCPQ